MLALNIQLNASQALWYDSKNPEKSDTYIKQMKRLARGNEANQYRTHAICHPYHSGRLVSRSVLL